MSEPSLPQKVSVQRQLLGPDFPVFAGEAPAEGDAEASRSVIFEILRNVVTGQTAAEQPGNRAENTSVYCGKTKVFMANSVVRALFPCLTALERNCVRGILAPVIVMV